MRVSVSPWMQVAKGKSMHTFRYSEYLPKWQLQLAWILHWGGQAFAPPWLALLGWYNQCLQNKTKKGLNGYRLWEYDRRKSYQLKFLTFKTSPSLTGWEQLNWTWREGWWPQGGRVQTHLPIIKPSKHKNLIWAQNDNCAFKTTVPLTF